MLLHGQLAGGQLAAVQLLAGGQLAAVQLLAAGQLAAVQLLAAVELLAVGQLHVACGNLWLRLGFYLQLLPCPCGLGCLPYHSKNFSNLFQIYPILFFSHLFTYPFLSYSILFLVSFSVVNARVPFSIPLAAPPFNVNRTNLNRGGSGPALHIFNWPGAYSWA